MDWLNMGVYHSASSIKNARQSSSVEPGIDIYMVRLHN
jgi:hypothetical protein